MLPIRPPALLAGPSGSGKSSALEAYEALARLCGGADLTDVFGTAGGGAAACVPQQAETRAADRG